MAGVLNDLINAYSTAGQQVWNAAKPYVTSVNSSKGTGSDLLNALSMGPTDTSFAADQNAAANGPTLGPAPTGPTDANGNLIGTGSPPPAVASATPAPAAAPAAAPGGAGMTTPAAPTNDPSMAPGVTLDDQGNVVSGDTSGQGNVPDQSGQAGAGGLLSNIMAAAQQGAQDPDAAKGFFSKMADSLSDMGDKLTHLSPAASQGLIAAGMNMMANNSGRLNLSQLVGGAGEAGLNEYQTVKQNQIAAQLKQQELAQTQWYQQQQILDARNKLQGFAPGTTVMSQNSFAQGQPGQMVGGQAVKQYLDYTAPNGVKYQYPVNALGARLGPNQTTDASIPDANQKVINQASTDAANANQALAQTNYYLNKIPTANIPGGLQGDFMSLYTKLGGDQTSGQALQQEIMRNMRSVSLQAFKSAVGNRVTQNEFNTMQAGLQGNLSGPALSQILQDYGRFQQIQAQRANTAYEFANENRGFMGSLYNDSVGTIGGQRYPAGTSYNDINAGTAKPLGAAAQAGANAPAAPSGSANAPTQPTAPRAPAPAVVAQAIRAAQNGDQNAIAALKKYKVPGWS